ncbi:hypothetical protein AEAC466_10955 [Asticcacaulis sp. AC466]|uniref:hypothetical protein n=1 Tax=Asticcacaulis sp. AC466 TaxID=1282362 RepID=UPI0003C3DCF3|nr:hypothetical protein [Asticcacaulis sp. AC466]ESQ83841.1 hypothetical protein AEAC466_10955 [Asticcacaulis sp. AC466]
MALPNPAPNDGPNLESSASGIHWTSILGGASVAIAISLILLPLGAALGFASFSVFNLTKASLITFSAGWAIWLVVTQWISSGVGGYIAGRLRVKWADTHSDEVFFRDTAHGFIAWSVATIFTIALIASAGAMTAKTAVDAGATVAAGAAAATADDAGYYADSLYRSTTAASTATAADVSAETVRILSRDTVTGGDRAYLASQVAARTGLSQVEAEKRVNSVLAEVEAAKQKAAEAAEAARKTLVGVHFILFLSLLIGAFIASVSAALGGRLRDNY